MARNRNLERGMVLVRPERGDMHRQLWGWSGIRFAGWWLKCEQRFAIREPMTLERRHIPDWAVRQRQRDMEWIGENLHIFGPVAAVAFDEEGQGAFVVGIKSRPTGQGHPFGYVLQAEIEELDDEDIKRMVREYDPDHESVVVMLKPNDHISTYRVQVLRRQH